MRPEELKEVPLKHRLPMTRIRLLGARVLYGAARVVLGETRRRAVRNGIVYDLDLSEGIDLSLFLFGSFQKHVFGGDGIALGADAVIIDVGANIGAMTLGFAKLAARGRVYAFEPTDYAFAKLLRNLELNPDLADRIITEKQFVSEHSSDDPCLSAYSSWKVDGSTKGAHPLHGGTEQVARVGATSIDDFCAARSIDRLDLVKIDTDGHELSVLRGAARTLERLRPTLIFEIGLYLLAERGIRFADYYEYLCAFGYRLTNTATKRAIDPANYLRQIPLRYTTDVLATPCVLPPSTSIPL